ncbi:MAG: hypothetical protein H0U23_07345 [Blastocatellia bacterium]|nr:hypothetical protein [Blastocatellia bacterium]
MTADPNWPYPPDEMQAHKIAFAAAYLRFPGDASAAAFSIERHPGRAYWICQNWAMDDSVLALMGKSLEEVGDRAAVPTKEQFAAQIWKDAMEVRGTNRLEYYELFAKIMGFVAKPADTVVNNNIVSVNRVIMMPHAKSMDDWEIGLKAQQARLINASTVN